MESDEQLFSSDCSHLPRWVDVPHPAQVPVAELDDCPRQTYQPAWQILPDSEAPPPPRTIACHPNGHWYDIETGRIVLFLIEPSRNPYGPKSARAGAGSDGGLGN